MIWGMNVHQHENNKDKSPKKKDKCISAYKNTCVIKTMHRFLKMLSIFYVEISFYFFSFSSSTFFEYILPTFIIIDLIDLSNRYFFKLYSCPYLTKFSNYLNHIIIIHLNKIKFRPNKCV